MFWGEVIGKTAHYLEGKGVAGAQTAAELSGVDFFRIDLFHTSIPLPL